MPLTPRQQADIDRLRGTSIVPSRTSLDAAWFTQPDWNRSVDRRVADYERANASMASHRRLVNIGRLASIAIPTAGIGLSAAGVGGPAVTAAAGAPASTGTSFLSTATAPTFGVPGSFGIPAAGSATSAAGTAATVAPRVLPATTSRLSSIFNSDGLQLGVGAGLNLLGQRSQNKANEQARADALAAQKQAIALQLAQIEEAKRNSDLDRDEMRRLNEQSHALQVQQLELQKQDQQYRRDVDARDEARLAPYRATADAARQRLASIWGI